MGWSVYGKSRPLKKVWAQRQVKFGRHRKGMLYRAGKKEQKQQEQLLLRRVMEEEKERVRSQ